MDAQPTVVSRIQTPPAPAWNCLPLALATRAPANGAHPGATAAAEVCAGATSCDGVWMYSMACMCLFVFALARRLMHAATAYLLYVVSAQPYFETTTA
jgi:hypothetical protein